MKQSFETPVLRDELRRSTREIHDVLDADLGPLALGTLPQFGQFLQVQYAARLSAEKWIALQFLDWAPPPAQTDLLAMDLEHLGLPLTEPVPFDAPAHCDPIGAVWALAGSSLGNRMILQKRDRMGLVTPPHFLPNAAMPAYFKAFRQRLERPADRGDDGAFAIAAANAVFASFSKATKAAREIASATGP